MSQTPFSKVIQALDVAADTLTSKDSNFKDAGIIDTVKDGILAVSGLKGIVMGEVLIVKETDSQAVVLEVFEDKAFAALLTTSETLRPGQHVIKSGSVLKVPSGDAILGRVVDPLGVPLDGRGAIKSDVSMTLEVRAPGVTDRKSVHEPLQTGILAIDALIPVGRGQRELIIGDRQTGKTTVAIDTIINQKSEGVICVYVAIGQRENKVMQVVETLKREGAMDYTIVVDASSSSPAALQYLAPYAGVAIAEHFMSKGKHVLIVYDDLSRHAVAYRELSLLIRRPPGREAYPGDVFYIHSRLLERAAKLSDALGAGSITALPIIETQAGDVSAYIPTNVISITDGQIFLESKLFYKGIRPAINYGISVSRVGGAAQTKIIKKIGGKAKLVLAQYADLAAFAQFASELDNESKSLLTRGERLTEGLKQKPNKPYLLWQEAVVMWIAMNGYLDKVPVKEVTEKISDFMLFFEGAGQEIIQTINQTKDFTPEVEQGFKSLAERFFAI